MKILLSVKLTIDHNVNRRSRPGGLHKYRNLRAIWLLVQKLSRHQLQSTMMMNGEKTTTPTKERKQSITQAPTQNIKVATFAPGHLWSITKRQRSKIWRHFTKFRDSALSQHHFLRRIRMMETSAWRNILDWWSPAYQGVFWASWEAASFCIARVTNYRICIIEHWPFFLCWTFSIAFRGRSILLFSMSREHQDYIGRLETFGHVRQEDFLPSVGGNSFFFSLKK